MQKYVPKAATTATRDAGHSGYAADAGSETVGEGRGAVPTPRGEADGFSSSGGGCTAQTARGTSGGENKCATYNGRRAGACEDWWIRVGGRPPQGDSAANRG